MVFRHTREHTDRFRARGTGGAFRGVVSLPVSGQQMPFTGGKSYGVLIANVFLFQGLPIWSRPTWNFSSWSISCEFVAYLVFSLVVVTGIGHCKAFFAAGTTLAIVSYCALAFARNTLDAVDWGLARCLAGFFFGMLIFHFAASARRQLSLGHAKSLWLSQSCSQCH
jgi:peptidoglycan/LPS O-acetylase OafA/YrhL